MPLRIDAPQSHAWRVRHVAAAFVAGIAALIAVQHFTGTSHRDELDARPVVAPAPAAAPLPHGRGTIVYEHPERCAESCARVLDTLNAVSHDPASGVPDGVAQIVVRASADPARDLIVLDPEGQPAGFISHASDPGRIAAGLATLRASEPAAASNASR
jgi:hypothetical protein